MIAQAMDGASLSTFDFCSGPWPSARSPRAGAALAGWLAGPARGLCRPGATASSGSASALLDLFRHLGATFIKVGQIMSTRPDLVPEHITQALAHLQDDVGPFPFEAVARTVIEDLGRPIDQVFAEFSPRPIASASVSQVHKARLHDGRVVAVKVRRPDVLEICTFDLAVMRKVAHLLGKIPSLAVDGARIHRRAVRPRHLRPARLSRRSPEQPPFSRELPQRARRCLSRGFRGITVRNAFCA
jgi:hypothetical protein